MLTNEPHVVLVLPLDGSDPRTEVKNAIAKAESLLMSSHRAQDAATVIQRLHRLARTISYPPQRSSAALFVSGNIEQLCYMAMKVEPQIIIDEPFRVRDLARCKRKDAEFIAVVLKDKQSNIYHGYKHPLRLVSAHKPEKIYAWLNEVPERTGSFSDPEDRQEVMLDKFLRHIDDDLGDVLNAWPLPVFVIGDQRITGHFASLTHHARNITAYIAKDFTPEAHQHLLDALAESLDQLDAARLRITLRQIESAVDAGRLEDGIDQVRSAADSRNSRLLVFEKDQPRQFYKEDSIDDIVEKVLSNGGEIKEVEKGALEKFHHIALVRYY